MSPRSTGCCGALGLLQQRKFQFSMSASGAYFLEVWSYFSIKCLTSKAQHLLFHFALILKAGDFLPPMIPPMDMCESGNPALCLWTLLGNNCSAAWDWPTVVCASSSLCLQFSHPGFFTCFLSHLPTQSKWWAHQSASQGCFCATV